MSFHRSISLGSYRGAEVTSHWKFWRKICVFLNVPLCGNFQNSVPKGFTISPIHVLCVNFVKFGRPEISKVVHYLPDKKKQNFASLCRLCADFAQNLAVSAADNVPRLPKFHPNLFTSIGVVAKRVNTIETHHKVFPIFRWSLASSWIMKQKCVRLFHLLFLFMEINKLNNKHHNNVFNFDYCIC